MYDVVVIGQGLSGLLTALWSRREGKKTALVARGAGKIVQSTGLLDLVPGTDANFTQWLQLHGLSGEAKQPVDQAVNSFKKLMKELDYPYYGEAQTTVPVVTGSGFIKQTALYPATVSPVPEKGEAVVVDFKELADFHARFVAENLQKERPQLKVDRIKIDLGKRTQRTMNQLDAALLLEQPSVRTACLKQIKQQLAKLKIKQPDFFIFPSVLGNLEWRQVKQDFDRELGAAITEVNGLPPNASANRLYEMLRLAVIRSNVRLYIDAAVNGVQLDGDSITAIDYVSGPRPARIAGKQFILATGGVLGGGLEITASGYRETALNLDVDEQGKLQRTPANLHPVGAALGTKQNRFGITGGIYTLLSCHQAVENVKKALERSVSHA